MGVCVLLFFGWTAQNGGFPFGFSVKPNRVPSKKDRPKWARKTKSRKNGCLSWCGHGLSECLIPSTATGSHNPPTSMEADDQRVLEDDFAFGMSVANARMAITAECGSPRELEIP